VVFRTIRFKVQALFGISHSKLRSLHSRIDWSQLEKILRYQISDKDLFVQALTHRSFIPISEQKLASNERLEFLGDSILNFVVAEYLYEKYPEKEEGELTVMRSRLVNRKALAFYAKEINLRTFLISHTTSTGVVEKGFETILADACEAVIAAIYKDGGMEKARRFILSRLESAITNGYLRESDENYKSELLELSQSICRGVPRYQMLKEEGPDHDRTFTIEVIIGTESMGTGIGKNKKEAEQAAAEIAVQKLQNQMQ